MEQPQQGHEDPGSNDNEGENVLETNAGPKAKRVIVTFKQKKEICEYAEMHASLSHEKLGMHFSRVHMKTISRSAITKILGKRDNYTSAGGLDLAAQRKRLRAPKFGGLDTAVANVASAKQAKIHDFYSRI